MSIKRFAAALLLALPILAGCRADEALKPSPRLADPLFLRYAALGNSITAGFQSGGISDETQRRTYAQLLARAMGTQFNYPQLNGRGCPPPFTNNVTQRRVGGASETDCDLRVPQRGLLNSVAVPGNAVATLLSNFGSPPSLFDGLKTIFLGGRTEVELMQQLHPTFVSVWIGNNDVLGAFIDLSNAGDTTQITPPAQFAAAYDDLADSIAATGARAVLISVGNVTAIPFASSAAIYFCLKYGGCPSPPFPPQNPILAAIPFSVDPSCAPPGGVNYLVPWPIALKKIGTAAKGKPTTLDCTHRRSVISPEELVAMQTAIAAYNAHISSVAQAHGWAYWDVNPAFTALRASGDIPAFPDVSGAFLPQPTSILFGPYFSLDGIHPSSLANRVAADSVAATINRVYGTNLPVPICAAVHCPPL